jgi:DNA-binding transcriptional ArsR family regulator
MKRLKHFTDNDLVKVSDMLKALSHPSRLSMALLLMNGELCCNDLMRALSVSQPTVSRHLAILHNRGFLQSTKKANQVFFRLSDPKVKRFVQKLRRSWLFELVVSMTKRKK